MASLTARESWRARALIGYRRFLERLTREATARLERRVREHPELWLWMHSRWRSRPGAGAADALALEESAR